MKHLIPEFEQWKKRYPAGFESSLVLPCLRRIQEDRGYVADSDIEDLMAYLGVVPSEHSSGGTKSRGGITKTGNGHVRRVLVEAAWAYRHPARKTAVLQRRAERTSEVVQEIAWKAQTRLCSRYRLFEARGKLKVQACTAIARELAGFIWAIGQALPQPAANA